MRYLNKIIFVNSANVKYTEIELNGNVHLTGNQGAGKTTLLRAVLFFYNADKTRLGISRESKNFDKFYFPAQNSYIFYEIVRDEQLYTIMAFKYFGRTAFRFIDSKFDKNHYINPDGMVYDSWDKIKENLSPDISYTKIISNYEDYRNILYGNTINYDIKLRKYSLLQSKQFQNIPRTIQNVFLNSKLDADFIKETIIKSLDENEIKIDLSIYSENHLYDFESSLGDIKKWTDKNNKSESPVKKLADNIINIYSRIKFLTAERRSIGARISYVKNRNGELVPEYKLDLNQKSNELSQIEDKIVKLEKQFLDRKQSHTTQIGIKTDFLSKLKTKKQFYKEKNIEDIQSRIGNKISLESELQENLTSLNLMTGKFTELAQKQTHIIDNLESSAKKYENQLVTEINELKEEFLTAKKNIDLEYEDILQQIDLDAKSQINSINQEIDKKNNLINTIEKQQVELKLSSFYREEIDQLNRKISFLEYSLKDAKHFIDLSNEKLETLRKQWDFDKTSIAKDSENKKKQLSRSIKSLKKQQVAINDKLTSKENSFYHWLNENIPEWHTNIGKLIDEESVLFAEDLDPVKLDTESSNFYGVDIDLSKIRKTVKNKAYYENELKEIEIQIADIQKEIDSELILNQELEKKARQKYSPKINELKDQINIKQYQIEQDEHKIKSYRLSKAEYEKKSEEQKQNEQDKQEAQKKLVVEDKEALNLQIEDINKKTKRRINTKLNEKDKQIALQQERVELKIGERKEKIDHKKLELANKIKEIRDHKKDSSTDKGFDKYQIEEVESKIKNIEEELAFIEANRDLLANYKKDKQEYFDQEKIVFEERRSLENKINTEKNEYDSEIRRVKANLSQSRKEFKRLQKKLSDIESDNHRFEEFKNSEAFDSYKSISESKYTKAEESDDSLSKLLEDYYANYYGEIKDSNSLQSSVNRFTDNFSENNIFKFRLKNTEYEDFVSFAEMLKEFIDEKKIEDYKKQVNDRFATIIRVIAKQTEQIISREGEIKKWIVKINKDFASKNFVKAIKKVEMRTVESTNRLMKILLEIMNFNKEHIDDVGEINLFTSSSRIENNEKAVRMLTLLVNEINSSKRDYLTLSDSFDLQFRITENDNDTNWVEKLSNVGSEGTDILVKAMLNIMLLNVFKNDASKKFKDFKLHCMMDEIGKLHPNNVEGILRFANERNIILINGSPTNYNTKNYKSVYHLSKDEKNVTRATRLIKSLTDFV
ncbi:MAG: ATP-binding protein [Marinifilaceae bacterium]|jgi:hypothetical protein|nr:ATP-binding protein [Marinifilaceae bacterium]